MIAGALAAARKSGHDGNDFSQTRRLPSRLALKHQDTDGAGVHIALRSTANQREPDSELRQER